MELSVMPVSMVAAAQPVAAAAPTQRGLGQSITVSVTQPAQALATTPATATTAVPGGNAVPNTLMPKAIREGSGVSGMIDKVRADFDAYRSRIGSGYQPAHGGGPNDMAGMVNHALRAQVEIFDTSIVFHAGLTVSQQSQNGVKTLIEKG